MYFCDARLDLNKAYTKSRGCTVVAYLLCEISSGTTAKTARPAIERLMRVFKGGRACSAPTGSLPLRLPD